MGFRPYRVDVLAPAMRRLEEVRVTLDDGHARAQVLGIGHRHRVAIPVSLSLATRLVADGAPLRICHRAVTEGH